MVYQVNFYFVWDKKHAKPGRQWRCRFYFFIDKLIDGKHVINNKAKVTEEQPACHIDHQH